MQADLKTLINRQAHVIGLQEVDLTRARQLRPFLARQGYGLAIQAGVPIAYKLSKFRLAKAGVRNLSPAKFVGPGGAGPTTARAKRANWVALVDKKTGNKSVFSNSHFTASRRMPKRAPLWHQQVTGTAELQRDLRQRFGPGVGLFFMGDLNTSKPGSLAPLRRAGLSTYQAPRKTHRVGRIDWIASNRKPGEREVVGGLHTDHSAYLATFGRTEKDKGKDGKDKDGKGGKGGKGPTDLDPKGPGNNNGGNVDNTSAYELFADLLESWGIPVGADIEEIIKNAIIEGYTPDMMELLIPDIQNTESWKSRFPGWHERVANGYNQLSVGEYLELEDAYHRIMEEAGLPAGFYDDPSDFGNWIAQDVSPDEIQNRVGLATDAAKKIDGTARNLMARFYGLTTGDIASYFLDQARALPVIQRQYESANVASWASKAGFDVTSMGRYENLVDSGITAEQAASAYGTVKSLSDTVGEIAGIYGETYGQGDAEEDVFFGRSDKRRRIVEAERGTFSGRSQGSTGSASRNPY